jgi:hypothetical protein
MAGAEEQAVSSTPKACGLVFHHPCPRPHRRAGLPCWRDAFELVAEMLEVIRADAQAEHFLDHRKEISQPLWSLRSGPAGTDDLAPCDTRVLSAGWGIGRMTEELEQLLKNLKLRRILEIYDEQLRAADKDDISYSDFVTRLVRAQWQAKQEGALEWRIRRANLPERWTLETFPFARQPGVNRKQIRGFGELEFTAKAENIVLVGKTGVGKTGLACGLLLKALENGYRCQFIRAQDLFDEMYASLADRSTRQLLKRLARLDVLLIDLCEVVSNVE